jgi:hypothetical protein
MIQKISEDLLWSQIAARAWCDEGLMERLRADPRAVLAEYNLEVPEDTEVKVLEGEEVKVVAEADMERHFILPATPPDELTDEDLIGGPMAWCVVVACGRCAACAACGVCGRCGRCGCRCW